MKKIGRLGLFIICLSVGILAALRTGLGGDQIDNIAFFGSLEAYTAGLIISLSAAIGITGVLSFLSPRGVSVAAAGVYIVCMEILLAMSSAIFFSLPWDLNIFGLVYIAVGTFIVFSDVSELIMQGG